MGWWGEEEREIWSIAACLSYLTTPPRHYPNTFQHPTTPLPQYSITSDNYLPTMRFLIHGSNTTPAVAAALVRHGHKVVTADEAKISPEASPEEFYTACHKAQVDVLTTDPDMAEAPLHTPVKFDRSLVFLQLTGGDVEQDDAIDRLFDRYKRLVPGRMYTVTGARVKIRQLPGQ